MKILSVVALLGLTSSFALPAFSQQKTPKELIVGTWLLDSGDDQTQDGETDLTANTDTQNIGSLNLALVTTQVPTVRLVQGPLFNSTGDLGTGNNAGSTASLQFNSVVAGDLLILQVHHWYHHHLLRRFWNLIFGGYQ